MEAEDSDGAITKVRLVGNSLVVAEAASSPLRFTLAKVPAGSYTLKAQAIDDQGAVGESGPACATILYFLAGHIGGKHQTSLA